MAKLKGKDMLKLLVLGGGVVIVTPILAGFIPDTINVISLKVIEIDQLLSAGLSAFGVQYLLEKFMK